jgi:hypothetical protein
MLGGGKFENGAVTGAFGYLLNMCLRGKGCYITDEQRTAAQQGDYESFYAACGAGSEYECHASGVALGNGTFLEKQAGYVLQNSLGGKYRAVSRVDGMVSDLDVSKSVGVEMNQIRVAIMRTYVEYMDTLGATAQHPVWPSHSSIDQFHVDIFSSHQVGNAYFGDNVDRLGTLGHQFIYNKCESCRP